jgi:RecA-family ATPase
MQALTLHLLQHRVDAVVFDTVRDYYEGDSKEALIANKTMIEFRKLAERAKVAVILITHTRKAAAGKSEMKIEDVADSRIFTSKADFVFGLQHEYRDDQSTLVQINNLKTRGAKPLPRIRYLMKDIEGMVYFEKNRNTFQQ